MMKSALERYGRSTTANEISADCGSNRLINTGKNFDSKGGSHWKRYLALEIVQLSAPQHRRQQPIGKPCDVMIVRKNKNEIAVDVFQLAAAKSVQQAVKA